MSEFEDTQPEKISLYNSGMAQIKRLDELWNKVHKHAEGGLLVKWNWVLDRVWCELIGDLAEIQEEDLEGLSEEMIKEKQNKNKENPIIKFNQLNLQIGAINKEFIARKIKSEEYQRRLYETLMDKEAFLRRLQNKLGKGTKLVDADEDMIE